MKLFVLGIVSLLAFANADVSHLLNANQHEQHPGYSYDEPSVPFELPKATYLPPEQPTTPKITYLPPPEKPAPTYLPPKTTPPPPPPTTTTPPPPKTEYLPPQQQNQKNQFEIPLPSYADSFLEPDSPHFAAAQPESTYLPPEPVKEHSADGYHYDAPAKRFRF